MHVYHKSLSLYLYINRQKFCISLLCLLTFFILSGCCFISNKPKIPHESMYWLSDCECCYLETCYFGNMTTVFNFDFTFPNLNSIVNNFNWKFQIKQKVGHMLTRLSKFSSILLSAWLSQTYRRVWIPNVIFIYDLYYRLKRKGHYSCRDRTHCLGALWCLEQMKEVWQLMTWPPSECEECPFLTVLSYLWTEDSFV